MGRDACAMRYTGVLESCTHTHTHTHTHTRKHTWRQFMFLARIKAGPAALLESRHVMMVVMVNMGQGENSRTKRLTS